MDAVLQIRVAAAGDCDLYFKWVNDPLVRSNSRQTAAVCIEEHSQWFDAALRSDHTLLYVIIGGDSPEKPVGQVRFDFRNDAHEWEVDFSIAASDRGRGYGAAAIGLALQELEKSSGHPVVAHVRRHNTASQACLRQNGFVVTSIDEQFVQLRRLQNPQAG